VHPAESSRDAISNGFPRTDHFRLLSQNARSWAVTNIHAAETLGRVKTSARIASENPIPERFLERFPV
jgi:hypothetical protein